KGFYKCGFYRNEGFLQSEASALTLSAPPISVNPWPQRTNLWRERTNLRTGSERLRGVIRRLDPEALAFFGLGHRWWRHPRPRMLRSSPEQSLALHRCLLEKDTNEETATRQRACDCKFPWLRPRRQFVFNDAAA